MKKYNWNTINKFEKEKLLARPAMANRKSLKASTANIINDVKQSGDDALYRLTKKHDQANLDNLLVTENEIDSALKLVKPEAANAINLAIERIKNYNKYFLPENKVIDTKDGIICEKISRPIQTVGLYVPGGTAPLVSTLMMLAIPADIAQCLNIILCTPPNADGNVDPNLLFTAKQCGVKTICKIGGAQAIAAMAYGTESIPRVDKIFGPGNIWVTEAKQIISQDPAGASIDMPAGPSEVMVIADADANPSFIAADLLSQAEHGADSQVILITDSNALASNVLANIEEQLEKLTRRSIAVISLSNSRIILVDDIKEAFPICNQYAPEHLILQIKKPRKYLPMVLNAGAIFIGAWTPETLGDYITGSNHVLPTYGYAKTYSGLSVSDYMTFISVQEASFNGLKQVGTEAMLLAEIEGLDAHKAAVDIRLRSRRE